MKTAWNIISFLAVVHLLAILLFAMWLWQSDRLDAERVQVLRETFSPTVTEARLIAMERSKLLEEEREREEMEKRLSQSPMAAPALLERVDQLEELERRTLRRIEDARRFHNDQFVQAMVEIEQRERELEQARAAWEQSVAEERARREDEQFAKTVLQYESAQPRQGKNMMMELIAEGQMDQAVAYLDAMNPRAASKILGEFRAEHEIQLATQLLERLRRFGLDAELEQESGHANDVAQAR
jgi:hypothetical protein